MSDLIETIEMIPLFHTFPFVLEDKVKLKIMITTLKRFFSIRIHFLYIISSKIEQLN